MRALRNVAIILLLAFVVAFVPGGGGAAQVFYAVIGLGFLSAIAWTVHVLGRQNQLTLATLSDGRRAVLYGALGLIALLAVGMDEMLASGGGTLAWILLFAAAVAGIWKVWVDASSY